MSKSPKRKTLHVIAKYFYESTNDVQAHIVKTYNAFNPEEWNITIHSTTDTLTNKDCLRKRQMIGEIQVRRSRSNFFGFSPKIQWEKTDLICLYGFKLFPHVFILLKTLYLKILGQKRYVLMLIPQGGYTPYWKRYHILRRIGKKIYHGVFGRILINLTTDSILTTSSWERHEMINKGIREDLLVTIPDGIEDEAFDDIDLKASSQIKSTSTRYGTYLLQLGRVQPLKNFETTIKSMTYLPDSINLVIAGPVGDKKYAKRLHNLAKKHHLEKRIFFHGIIRNYDKYFLIKKAKLLIHIPLWDANGTVIYEAMSQGLVGIVANQGAPAGIVKDEIDGYLINPQDDLELGKKIHNILNTPHSSKLKHIITRNVNSAQELKASRLQKRLEILYTAILMKQKYPYRLTASRVH